MDFNNLTQQQKEHLWNILVQLSSMQRKCYLAHVVNLWSFKRIAEEFNIGRSTVQKHIKRAREKIKQLT